MLWLHGNNSILRAAILALAGIPYKYNQCRTTLGGLSSVCAKLEPLSSKNNEIHNRQINVLQKFTPHALWLNREVKLLNNSVIFEDTELKFGMETTSGHLIQKVTSN